MLHNHNLHDKIKKIHTSAESKTMILLEMMCQTMSARTATCNYMFVDMAVLPAAQVVAIEQSSTMLHRSINIWRRASFVSSIAVKLCTLMLSRKQDYMSYHHVANRGSTDIEKGEGCANDGYNSCPIHVSATSKGDICAKHL